jgi:hypothetical protein
MVEFPACVPFMLWVRNNGKEDWCKASLMARGRNLSCFAAEIIGKQVGEKVY